MIDHVLDRYADLLLEKGLNLHKDDVLTINTEEVNAAFAYHIAKKAKAITGIGCYIQTIENGRIVSTEETEAGHFIERRPTAFLYIPTFRRMPSPELGKEYTAPELQRFRLLSDPLDNNTTPLVPFTTAYLPSETWGEALGEDLRFTYALLTNLLSLEEDSPNSILDELSDIIKYETKKLNTGELVSCHIESEEGTDLSFNFLKDSVFTSDLEVTKDGRTFSPTLLPSSIFRAVDPRSVNGYLTTTRPFQLFGVEVRSLSLQYEAGKLISYISDPETMALFELYLGQDVKAGALTELSLSEESNPAARLELSLIPEWDRLRTTSVCLGGPRAKSLTDSTKANDCIVSLFLPIGSDELSITATDKNGEEITVLSDGIMTEDD